MNIERITDYEEIDRSILQGHITARYEDLVKKFGEPERSLSVGGTQVEWWLKIDGVVVTIYDWKKYGVPVEEITSWNVGGFEGEGGFDLLRQVLKIN